MSRDPEAGISTDPRSLHKYLYAGGDPINRIDPSGRGELNDFKLTLIVGGSAVSPLMAFVGGSLNQIAAEAAYIEAGAYTIEQYLEALMQDWAAGEFNAAWNDLVLSVNEFDAMMAQADKWGGITRLIYCTTLGIVSTGILEWGDVFSPKYGRVIETGSIFGCEAYLHIIVH